MSRQKYNLGDKINAWTVIQFDKSKSPRSYEVMCQCGFRKWCTPAQIKSTKACRRCSTADKINVGDRFGPSVVLKELPRVKWGRLFLVDCDCGNTHELIHKTLKSRKVCSGEVGDGLQGGSAIAQALRAFPGAPRGIKKSKVYELWLWLRKEQHAALCERWMNSFPDFVRDFSAMLGGHPHEYLRPKVEWVYYTFERIDKEGIWEPDNVAARKFFSERAYHRDTYKYWRLLSSRELLTPELEESYTLFLNTFGEKQVGYVLKRREKRRLHSADNSFWYQYSKLAAPVEGDRPE